jgi:hypothetical protein
MAHAHTSNPDKGAAFTGLVTAVVFLLVTVFAIVKLTNSMYAGEGGHAAAAEATH